MKRLATACVSIALATGQAAAEPLDMALRTGDAYLSKCGRGASHEQTVACTAYIVGAYNLLVLLSDFQAVDMRGTCLPEPSYPIYAAVTTMLDDHIRRLPEAQRRAPTPAILLGALREGFPCRN